MPELRKTPLWQADTTTTVGRAPQPASSALSSVAGPTVPRACFRTKPLSSPWLVMKARQASPPAVRSALDTFAAVATSSDGLAPGSEVSARISRTPRAASLARIAATPLSKAGLLLSPAISTTRQRSAGTTPSDSIAICCEVRAEGGGAAACSGVHAATRRETTRSALNPAVICHPLFSSRYYCGLAPTARSAMSA